MNNANKSKATETVISATSDATTVRKILAIRSAARARLGIITDLCPTCGRSERAGYSRHNGKVIIEGCVDACHVAHESGNTNRGAWITSQNARKIRRAELKGLTR